MLSKGKTTDYVFLHLVFLIVALGNVAAKTAGGAPVLSGRWIVFYGLFLGSMGVYALLWQQVLKRIPLTTAFCNKAVTIVWSMLFGLLFFGEAITWRNLLGAAIVIVGVLLVVTGDE